MRTTRASRATRSLANAKIDHFRKHGWVAMKNFWNDEELKALRLGLTHLQHNGRLANVACEDDGVTHTEAPKNLQLCPLSPELPIFRSLPFHQRVVGAVRSLLCDDVSEDVYCYLSQTFWKPAKQGLGTGWHQDNAYFQIEDRHAIKGTAMWTAVHDATIANGTLKIAPGFSHTLDHVRDLSSDHHITCAASIDESETVDIEIPAGGAIFFNFLTPHATGPNQTAQPRAGIAYHFLHQKHFKFREFPLPEEAEYVTPLIGPNGTGGEEEYGRRVDTWEEDMKAALALESELDSPVAR